MAYKMRPRNQRVNYDERADFSASGDESHDSTHSDPNYTRSRRRKRSQAQANIDVNTSGAAADQMQQHGDGADASSSRNIGVTGRTSARRRPQVRRRRRRTNLVQNPVTKGEVPVPEPEPDIKTILSWLTDKGILPEGQEVFYLNNGITLGHIHKGGVRCRCCEQVLNVYEFERHQHSNFNEPYNNVVTMGPSRTKLLELMIYAWNREDEVAHHRFFDVEVLRTGASAGAVDWSDESDDACMICADGGDLICCDTCPSTFHYSCMGMQNIPKEDWQCYYCLCKYCLVPSGNVESCLQCEKKYHSKCQEERNILVLRNGSSFCDTTCANIYNGLKNMVGARNELDDGLSWSLLQQMQVMEPVSEAEKHRIMETNCKIGVAWTVMDECFESNIDRHTRIDVLQRVIYNCGSNLMRINFTRFFTAVLEKDDNIISVAALRVHGSKIAEIPFIATRPGYRRQGMLRKLFNAIESTLSRLKVENIIIPSVDEVVGMWKKEYGFFSIRDELMNELVKHNTLTFPTVVRLQKSLVARPTEAKPYYEAKNPSRVLTKDNADNNPSRPVHMEVNGADNNRNENNLNPNYNSRKILPFDLNLEPPDDDDDNVVYN
ncbi:hypothetical protein ACOSQ2_025689 [Xanthoceras sorbifolium]